MADALPNRTVLVPYCAWFTEMAPPADPSTIMPRTPAPPPPPPMPPMGGGGPPMPPMGGGGPGGPPGIQPGRMPPTAMPPMGRKRGGKVMTAGAGNGIGRREKGDR